MRVTQAIVLVVAPTLAVLAVLARPNDALLAVLALVTIYGAIALLTRQLLAAAPPEAVAKASSGPRSQKRELGLGLRRLLSGPRHRAPVR